MADHAVDTVVEILVDGQIMSRNFALPAHRTKVKHGKTDAGPDMHRAVSHGSHSR